MHDSEGLLSQMNKGLRVQAKIERKLSITLIVNNTKLIMNTYVKQQRAKHKILFSRTKDSQVLLNLQT